MEIKRDALLRIVKATRAAMKLSKNIESLLIDKNAWNIGDQIAGDLQESLFQISGEELAREKNFDDSMTMRLLNGDLDDGTVADWFFMMNKIKKRIQSNKVETAEVQQPKPQIMDPNGVNELYEKNGGYKYTPEGEWK